jgi:phosphatidylserine/phosphatidylglycerophosphate/cardiolipin synthase-like enzyme
MTQQPPITVPIALSCTRSAVITLPWFVQQTEYRLARSNYRPLVNGEAAFGALYRAIEKATASIDYICWGFQPSMYFIRDGHSMRIGDLLIQKARQGVKIRILCWLDKLHIAQLGEPSMPMYDLSRFKSQNEDSVQRAYDWNWYFRARLPASSAKGRARRASAQQIGAQLRLDGVTASRPSLVAESLRDIGIELATRDFSLDDREEIRYRENLLREAGIGPSWSAANVGYTLEPSHHQKMVLIDYEKPEAAVGFVMGHNTLDAYWDDDAHSCVSKAPNRGRNGATPRQDMSAIVAGPILRYLNENFCRAWDRETNEGLFHRRWPLQDKLAPRDEIGARVMAQINRTQSQEGVRNIEKMYLQVVNNATKFIYIENQYFRWPALATQIKQAVAAQICGGRDASDPVYLFVVTNSDADALDKGQGTTYDMLNSLGQARGMPNVYRLEQRDALASQYDAARVKKLRASSSGAQAHDALADIASVDQQRAKLDNMKDEDIPALDIPGLKTIVCTLVAPDSPPGSWMQVYVHSKIMIIDDVFLTHGSANVNRRSMEVDSELNICHECMDVTRPLRRKLWGIHTAQTGAQDDPMVAFATWSYILKTNESRQGAKNASPYASLIGFKSMTTKRSRMD